MSMNTKLVIVGGVAAGAAAATRARRLDEHAEIVIFERSGYVSFANCGLPYHVGGIIKDRRKLLVATPELLRARFNIDVRVGHEVIDIDCPAKRVRVRELSTGREFTHEYDKLILAPGAGPILPPVQGAQSDNVVVLRSIEDMDALEAQLDRLGVRRVAIIGAGFIGLEVAEALRHRSLDVDIIELASQVLTPLDEDMAAVVARHVEDQGVSLHLGDGLDSFETKGDFATAVVTQSGRIIPTDLVLMSIGVRPNTSLAKEAGLKLTDRGAIVVSGTLATSDPDIFAAGDAIQTVSALTGQGVHVPLAGPATKHGRLAGQRSVTGDGRLAAPVAGTAIVKVFDLTVATTGLCVKAARREQIECDHVVARRAHHVDYYPGAEPMWVKLVYAAGDGRVLGAQIVGGAGVDRRIDVIASVIHFGGTIDDLADLDLAYAPPYGAAKDPLHIAAHIAQNQRDGLIRHIDPAGVAELVASGCQIVDVRTPKEFAAGTLQGAINLPVDELRANAQRLDPDKPILVFCAVGQRGYVAARILVQRGFSDVTNLAGGYSWYASQGL